MTWSLWLDDQANDPTMPDRSPPTNDPFFHKRNWKIAKTSKQAMKLVNEFGPPTHMDLDHDLGQAPDRMGLDNTFHFLHWLSNRHPQSIRNITWTTHSRNPDCNKRMDSYLDSWKRSLDLPGME